MLEELYYIHNKVISGTPLAFKRYLFEDIDWDAQCICVTGGRGVGKTTLLLQHYHERYDDVESCLYLSADNVEVSAMGLFRTAKEYFSYGGKALIIDEIHKYPGWQVELKNMIDTFKDRKFLISGSSSLELVDSKADLSRRVLYYNLKGLSFREYLELKENIKVPQRTTGEILKHHVSMAAAISKDHPPLKYFREYLRSGYYPFFLEGERSYLARVLNTIEKTIYEDIAVTGGMKAQNVTILKKILWLVATSVPFSVNIDKMSREFGVSREYVYIYLEYLDRSGLVRLVNAGGKGYRAARKPSKIFLENTNILYSINHHLMSELELGMMRETFFVNQMSVRSKVTSAPKGDFIVDGRSTFEIGGRDKNSSQLGGVKDAYVAADRIEIGQGNKIPLYLFGCTY